MTAPSPASPASKELAPVGPVGMLDRAIGSARRGGLAVAGPAWLGGALVAMVCLGIYYVERVEGVHGLRPLFALALVLAWWGRVTLLGRAARRATTRLWEAAAEPGAGRALDGLRTSLVAALGLWVWSWLLVLGSLAGPVGVVLVLPLLSLRGANAPSWLARSACTSAGGLRAFWRAVADGSGRRSAGVVTEGMMLAGALGLAINLYATLLALVLLARSFLGISAATLDAFLSPSNTFLQLVLGAAALVALEPVRACVSAAAYVDARVRAEGLDLRASLEDAIRHAGQGRRPRRAGAVGGGARAAILLVALTAFAPAALAQGTPRGPGHDRPEAFEGGDLRLPPAALPQAPAALPSDPGAMPASDPSPADRRVQAQVEGILGRPEFREFEDHRADGVRGLMDRLLDWAARSPAELPSIEAPAFARLALPGAWFYLALGALLLVIVGLYLILGRRREEQESRRAAVSALDGDDLRERAPESWLREAASLADGGELRQALRALYLATLVSLDRRRLIAFDVHRTNWQYLRQMPRGGERETFRQLTRLFDHKWYGHEPTGRDDYERCRALAARIVGGEDERRAA